jgi:hypothetical protein
VSQEKDSLRALRSTQETSSLNPTARESRDFAPTSLGILMASSDKTSHRRVVLVQTKEHFVSSVQRCTVLSRSYVWSLLFQFPRMKYESD